MAKKWSAFNTKASVSDNNYVMGLDTSLPVVDQNFKITCANTLPYFSGFSKIVVVTGGNYIVQDADNGALLVCTDNVPRIIIFPILDSKPNRFSVRVLKQNTGNVTFSVQVPGVLTGPGLISNQGTFLDVAKVGPTQWDSMGSEITPFVSFTAETITANIVTGLSNPSGATDATNKQYVDGLITALQAGLSVKNSCAAATITFLPPGVTSFIYDNGAFGVGATITFNAAVNAVGGVTLSDGDRIIANDPGAVFKKYNGIYTRTSSTIWTRATDYDTTSEIFAGTYTIVEEGDYAGRLFVMMTAGAITVGTTDISFNQWSVISAGDGTLLTGNTLSVDVDGSTIEINTNKLRVKGATGTEIGYLSGVTSAIQTQLNAKQTTALTSANILVGNGSNVAAAVSMSGNATIDNTGAVSVTGTTGNVVNSTIADFIVTKSGNQLGISKGVETTITFDTEIKDQGNYFTANTFTAPVTGTYLFTFSGTAFNFNAATRWYVRLITSNRSIDLFRISPTAIADFNAQACLSGIARVDMDAGDTAYLVSSMDGGASTYDLAGGSAQGCFFSGKLEC